MMLHAPNPLMPTMHAVEFPWVADAAMVRRLTALDRRPNFLIRCDGGEASRMLETLMQECARPFQVCTLPGPLELPPHETATFVLENVSMLTMAQQIRLHDWMSRSLGRNQVISLAFEPVYPLVPQGHFLEGLFYRLNVVSLEAGTR